jgi:isochorismate synthase EntC
VTARVRPETHVLDLVKRLHPTPAVAGAPRAAALEAIRRLEPRSRGWYAGPLGWVSATGAGDFTVGLRSAYLHGGLALLFAGAGIVAGSDADREWEDCESKMNVIEEALRREGA